MFLHVRVRLRSHFPPPNILRLWTPSCVFSRSPTEGRLVAPSRAVRCESAANACVQVFVRACFQLNWVVPESERAAPHGQRAPL